MSEAPAPGNSSEVETDYAKNKFFVYYFVFWGVVSIALFACSWYFSWGFWGWFGAVFALMVAAGGAGGMAKTGGAGVLACPACGEQVKVLHISEHRVIRCDSCKAWLEGAERMNVVPDDRIADHPAFRTYLPRSHAWPPGCVHCQAPATRELEVESTSSATGTYSKVSVPFCDAHDGNSIFIERESRGTFISFASLDYYRKFKQLNAKDAS